MAVPFYWSDQLQSNLNLKNAHSNSAISDVQKLSWSLTFQVVQNLLVQKSIPNLVQHGAIHTRWNSCQGQRKIYREWGTKLEWNVR